MEKRSSRRSPYRHEDNIEIESIDYFESYVDDENVDVKEEEAVDGFGEEVSSELDANMMEIVPLTPTSNVGGHFTQSCKDDSNEYSSMQQRDNQGSPIEEQHDITPATEPPKRSSAWRSLLSPQDWMPQNYIIKESFPIEKIRRRTPLKAIQGSIDGSSQSYLPKKLHTSPDGTALNFESTGATASPTLLASHATNRDLSPGGHSLSTAYTAYSRVEGGSSTMSSFRRMPNMAHRSSTSLSLLHGEVISLDPGRRTSSYACDSDSGSVAQARRFHGEIDDNPQYEPAFDVESGISLEGMEIGGGPRRPAVANHRFPISPNHQHDNINVLWDKFSQLLNEVQRQTVHLGSKTYSEINKLSGKAVEATQRALLNYRFHPVSPTRTRELEDLGYLQRCHKEKLGHLVEKDSEDHYDFVLVLTPQEAYRYWSDLLDLRLEHLGVDDLSFVNTPLETMSTNSTESSQSEGQYDGSMVDHVTPLTGIYRRRGKTSLTPPSTRTTINDSRPSIATSVLSSVTKRSNNRLSMFEKAVGYNSPTFKKLEESSILGDLSSPSPMLDNRRSVSSVRRRWGNRTGGKPGTSTMLSPPVRSLTLGIGSVRKPRMSSVVPSKILTSETENAVSAFTASSRDEEFPNPVIPRGIAARTNGLLQFLSALKRGIVVRRHRPNTEAVYVKIHSNDGGDTILYQMIEAEEAMVAFKEQRIRYNRNLNHGSSPNTVRTYSREWSCDTPGDGSPVHKFKLPDFIAAKRYREKVMKRHGVTRKFMDFAAKAANSGIARASDIVAVHPASHLDPRFPGSRKGEIGTSSLRRSKSTYHAPFAFSLVTIVGKRFKSGKSNDVDTNENKWYSGEGSELQFKILDFEAATEGEYWLVFRGFLLLHRDAAVGRFALERRAGIGGGTRRDREDGDGEEDEKENRLHQNEFGEPVTAGLLEKLYVKLRKMDDSYMKGYVLPGAIAPPSDYFLGFCSPGTQVRFPL